MSDFEVCPCGTLQRLADAKRLQGRINLLELANAEMFDALSKLQNERNELKKLLANITALVRGECPSLLDEDRDGDGKLSLAIDAAIKGGGNG